MSSNWISVNDKLPDDPRWVLVYADGAMNCMGFSRGEFVDFHHNPRNNISISKITYWMELPERPGLERVAPEPRVRSVSVTVNFEE